VSWESSLGPRARERERPVPRRLPLRVGRLRREDGGKAMIERFCVGAMDVEHALRVFRGIPRKAVVTGGHRTDIQLAALETDTVCLVLTGGVAPNELILARAREKGVALLTVAEDTVATVDRFESLLGRLRIREPEKARRGVELVRAAVDTAGLLSLCRLSP